MSASAATPWQVEVFYDGDCPMCSKEIAILRRWDKKCRIKFTDLADPEFDSAALGKSRDELMEQMHGRLPDGQWIKGVETFRRMYAAVGFGPAVFLSRLPILSQLLSLTYWIFAKNRLRLAGRCSPNGACRVPTRMKTQSPDRV
jgi:predicted DCC family thiol-disulfide oxidoreductase YuxK